VAAEVLEALESHPAKIRTQVEFIIGHGDAAPVARLNLTPRAKKVLELAAAESRRLEHDQVGTHHLLLGLVREGDGIAAQVLQSLGITLETVRTEVVAVLAECAAFQETDLIEEPMPLLSFMTGRVRSIVRFAEEEAKRLGHTYYGTEHLLLGLLREGEGNAVRVLTEAGMTLRVAREAIAAILADGNEYATLHAGPAPGYERTLVSAINQSLSQGHHFNGSEHLLIAMAEDRESVAGSVFHYLAVDVVNLATRALAAIDPERDADRGNPARIPDDVGIDPPRFGPLDLTDVQLTRLKSPTYQKSRTTITQLSRLALDEARQLGHPFVGTEHLLIALTDSRRGGGAATLLAEVGVTPKTARIAVEVRFGRSTARIVERGYTRYGSARLNLVIDQAFDLADPQAGRHVLPEHLLLAILDQEGGSAIRVLDSLRIDRPKLRAEVESKLQPDEPDMPTPSAE
jgi:ATP-dependent Clp protease ATP-binding subunit ClpA